ncbi:hypothetical protein ICI42_22460 [Tianweitania sp. Rool2]|uniref:Uncharacterized protein n=1 Tax=Oryzicola mucosus TaxID=2767425 RepID=A0A8J6PN40_9HYPH|nr:hypothetical protein [Oryzicola mucosus]
MPLRLALRRQGGVIGVDDEDGEELRGLGLAGVGADVMAVARHLGEVLTGDEVFVSPPFTALRIAPSRTVA